MSESLADLRDGGAEGTAAVTGLLGGAAIPLVQYALWEFTSAGPLRVHGGGELEAEFALFVALGVAIPAGGVALLYRDDPVAGVVGAVTVLAVSLVLGVVVSVPWWFRGGLVGAALLLAGVGLLEWLSVRRGRAPG